MNRQTLMALAPIAVIGGLLLLVIVLSQQKPPNIAMLRLVLCTLAIAAPLLLAICLLVGIRLHGCFWMIGQGWITAQSHPFLFRAVIAALLFFLSIPMLIGILTAFCLIPFSIRIDGKTYTDPGTPSTQIQAH